MIPIILPRNKAGIAILIGLNVVGLGLLFTTGVGFYAIPCIAFLFMLVGSLIWKMPSYWLPILLSAAVVLCIILGLVLTGGQFRPVEPSQVTIGYVAGFYMLGLAAAGIFLGFVEFGLLRLLGQFRLGAISRITYYEGLLQPFTLIVLFSGIITISIFARVSFFTYDEDFKMYRDVASSFLFLFCLPVLIFASTKVIDEEIENRTMLTLMSKPVARWQVVLGKYLGVLMLVLVVVVTLGIIAAVCGYLRYYDDKTVDFRVASSKEYVESLYLENLKALFALAPSVVLQILQMATLAAISVAVSTRYGLAVNVTAVILVYMAANLARYRGLAASLPPPFEQLVTAVSFLLPNLGLLDLNPRLIFGDFVLGSGDPISTQPASLLMPWYGDLWLYVRDAAIYSFFYISGALCFGIALFRSRELS